MSLLFFLWLPESCLIYLQDFTEDKNEFLSDAMMAEMEASIYGLQVDHH